MMSNLTAISNDVTTLKLYYFILARGFLDGVGDTEMCKNVQFIYIDYIVTII